MSISKPTYAQYFSPCMASIYDALFVSGVIPHSFSHSVVPSTRVLTLNYLRNINDVPLTYNAGKLCTEDPVQVSVSRKFCMKFHDFFQTVLKKGEVLRFLLEERLPIQHEGLHTTMFAVDKDSLVIGHDDPDKSRC